MTDPQPRLGLAGKSGWPRMKATETEVAGQLRQFLLSGKITSATVADGASRDQMTLGLVGARFPKAVAALGRPSILALTRALGPGVCSWCAAAMIAAGDHEPAPSLDSAAHRALLGSPCARCQRRHAAGQVAVRERAHLAEVVASGLKPAAAARLRTSGEVRRHAAAIRKLQRDPPPLAPTGFLWAAGPEPAAVTASIQAALGRRPAPAPTPPPAITHKTPVPHYYIPFKNRRRWPDDR